MDNFQFSQASAGQLKIWTVQLFKKLRRMGIRIYSKRYRGGLRKKLTETMVAKSSVDLRNNSAFEK